MLGGVLLPCSVAPLTGFFRDGCCRTGPDDVGVHTVCAVMTPEFLEFTVAAGNDLVTPHPEWNFPGLVAGDRWCLCAARWLEAFHAGKAPPVVPPPMPPVKAPDSAAPMKAPDPMAPVPPQK